MSGFDGSRSELRAPDTDIAGGEGTIPGEITAAGLRSTELLATACGDGVPERRQPTERRLVPERRR